MSVFSLLVGLGLAAFAAGCLRKAVRYARMPAHVRWELYPVPHGPLGQARTIAEEIVTLRMVRERNPRLWLPSLSFHYGLYLLFSLGAALLASALLTAAGLHVRWLEGSPLLSIWGGLGIAAGLFGALGLLVRRSLDSGIRASSTPGDFVNLSFTLALFAVSGATWLVADRDYAGAGAFLTAMCRGRGAVAASPWVLAEVLLLGAFLAYLPATHMTHFFGKWFTWHAVRWNEDPVVKGGALELEMQRLLGGPIHWSASHIGADGAKTWADVATEDRP